MGISKMAVYVCERQTSEADTNYAIIDLGSLYEGNIQLF